MVCAPIRDVEKTMFTQRPETMPVARAAAAALAVPSSYSQAAAASAVQDLGAKLLPKQPGTECCAVGRHEGAPLADSAAGPSSSLPSEEVQSKLSSSLHIPQKCQSQTNSCMKPCLQGSLDAFELRLNDAIATLGTVPNFSCIIPVQSVLVNTQDKCKQRHQIL